MVATHSTMLPLGTRAPDFTLATPDGQKVTLKDYTGVAGLVVVFMCNHCPYVKHISRELARVAEEYQKRRVAFVGINSNDVERYPADSPEKMREEARTAGYTFPYLFDSTQEVAQRYKAACTPDIYIFDSELRLYYRGQFDDTRPSSGLPATGKDLTEALEAMLAGQPSPEVQKPSLGCNIKWKPGNEPNYS